MQITFYGAAREVTGSMHMIRAGENQVLLDCGMHQGRRKEADRKNRVFPVDPRRITSTVLSHAHIDHCGRIPVLTRDGFTGRVICTRATRDVAEYLLLDSAYIQESDALYLNYKSARRNLLQTSGNGISPKEQKEIGRTLKKNEQRLNPSVIDELIARYSLKRVEPLYTVGDAEKALTHFEGYPYGEPVIIGQDMTCTFYDAGHILGSAIAIIHIRENGREYVVGYTGDVGRFNRPIVHDPTTSFVEEDRRLDLLVMESTYGDREHEPVGNLGEQLKRNILETVEEGGVVVIPAFAYGRTQELVYILHLLYKNREIPDLPVFVDSPLASRLTRVFGEHPEVYDEETHEDFLEEGRNPFMFGHMNYVSSVEESMALMRRTEPHIVIASSGMCEGGRILHHLRYKIHNPKNRILIVGYMAQNTLGRRLLELGTAYEASGRVGPPPEVRFLDSIYPLKARVVVLDGFSAHGDKNELKRLVKQSNLEIKRIALVHGEEDQSLALARNLEAEGFRVNVPFRGDTLFLGVS